ncbi:aldo/keto reductase [Paenibacillus sp. NPDC058177]|uniref:aldo/keto reductase n=1 Tax=Paenibacillus sp. NPDC058177 TaxID=3346369 RepID=UPI0036D81C6D
MFGDKAEVRGVSPARSSLAWLLSKLVVTSVIVGAKRLEQLEVNMAAAEKELTLEEFQQLDEVSALTPE